MTSAYRQTAEQYRKRADEQPYDDIPVTQEQWRALCLGAAEYFDDLSARHEAAIDEGPDAERAFWKAERDR